MSLDTFWYFFRTFSTWKKIALDPYQFVLDVVEKIATRTLLK